MFDVLLPENLVVMICGREAAWRSTMGPFIWLCLRLMPRTFGQELPLSLRSGEHVIICILELALRPAPLVFVDFRVLALHLHRKLVGRDASWRPYKLGQPAKVPVPNVLRQERSFRRCQSFRTVETL